MLNTTAVAINVGATLLGGPGLSTAFRDALQAGESGMARSLLTHVPLEGETTLFQAYKTYALDFGKQFVKTSLKSQFDPANMFWRFMKLSNTAELQAVNNLASEYGVEKQGGTFDLYSLTALDPSGVSSMVTSFTKYGSCASSQFSVNPAEINFGSPFGRSSATVTLLAQRKTTVTRIVSPAFSNASITSTANRIGKTLLPAQSCAITVTIDGQAKLDSEIRIYSNEYTNVPYAVHILANTNGAPAQLVPGVDEASSLTSITGVWATNNNQNQKMIVDSTGSVTVGGGSLVAAPAGDVGHAFRFSMPGFTNASSVYTLNDAGDHLIGPVFDGPITLPSLGRTLDVYGASTAFGTPIIQYSSNGQPNQRFSFSPQDDGTYQIVAAHSGLVFDVWGLSKDPGAPVKQNSWNAV